MLSQDCRTRPFPSRPQIIQKLRRRFPARRQLCLTGPCVLLRSPGISESEARLRLASRPSAVSTSMWQVDPEHELAFGLCDLGLGERSWDCRKARSFDLESTLIGQV